MNITHSPRAVSLLVGLVFLATIIGAWIFEWAGYAPCQLCLWQRWAYYVITPLALALAWLNPSWIRPGLAVLAIGFLASAVFGVYHSGVEWGWWEGPSTCGAGELGGGLPDLSKPVVLCNEAAIRIFGLSLAGWNAVISLALAVLSARAAYGSSSVSQ